MKGTTPDKEIVLTRKICAGLVVFAAVLAFLPSWGGAAQTGSIKGRVSDETGKPLAGAYLYLGSPALPGISNYMTSKTGHFMFPMIPLGTYWVTVEHPSYKTVTIQGILVLSGVTATVDFKMEPSQTEGERTERERGSGIDRESPRNAFFLEQEVIARLPGSRDFSAALSLVPGLVFEVEPTFSRGSTHGAPFTANAFVLDGVDTTNPAFGDPMGRINVDLIDHVVVETAGLPADTGPAQGAYVQIVHQSGGNSASGSLAYTHAPKKLARQVWKEDDVAAIGREPLAAPESEYDYSWTAGGPVLEDIAWYFSNIRYRTSSRATSFETWGDPVGTTHFPFDFKDRDLSGLFKLSGGLTNSFRVVMEFGLSKVTQSAYVPELSWYRTRSATRKLDGANLFTGRGGLTYIVGRKTVVDLYLGYASSKQPIYMNALSPDKPQYHDLATGYSWGSGSLNELEKANRLRVGGVLTHLLDRFFGLPQELVVGGEYEATSSDSSVWKTDNLIYNYLNGSPYALGETVSPASGNTVGFGLIGFWIAPKDQGNLSVQRDVKRLGFFARDTLRVAGRLFLSLGLRYDRSDARFDSVPKGVSGNGQSMGVGEALISPLLGFNPYSSFSLGQWNDAITWNTFSPRFGLSWDLLGNGRTVLKGSYSKMPEHLGLGYSRDLTPLDPRRSHNFYWYDENENAVVDAGDTFRLFADDYRVYKQEYYKQAVDPDLQAPTIEEWTAGFEQEIARDFTLSFRAISRTHRNLTGNALYDPSTEVSWSRVADSPEGWWVPFTTVVPGTGGYPDVPVTVYYRSATAPLFFGRIENIPELRAKYRGYEFSFRKRMSHNWQLLGSLVWSRSTGTTGLASPWSAGNSAAFLSPNSFINHSEAALLVPDRPLSVRLMGTVRFRWDIFLSFLFRAQSGAPWARSVTIIPPEIWAQANQADRTPVTVFLEEPGTNRYGSWKNLDLRVEKEFRKGGRTRFAVSVDLLNLLGNKYGILDLNDGGSWSPEGEGAGPGVRTLSGTYDTYLPIWGIQSVRFNLSLRF